MSKQVFFLFVLMGLPVSVVSKGIVRSKIKKKIETLYPKVYFVKTLKIPEEYIKGFQYYLIENTSFVRVLNTNNNGSTTFLMV